MRRVAIVGIGSTTFGAHPARSIDTLAVDAGIERDRIGALYLGNFVSGILSCQEVLAGLVADRLGLPDVPCTKVEGACASGGIAFRQAYLSVATGHCDVALAVGVEKMSHRSTPDVTAALNCALDNENDGGSGVTFPGVFGMAWRSYAHRYRATPDE